MASQRVGIVLMAYGTPSSREDVARYYTHIRHGRPPSDQEVAELQARYDAIGGVSPLAAITERQAQGLEQALSRLDPSRRYRVFMGMKHAPPFIAEAVEAMVASQVERAVGLVLAPQYSRFSVGTYFDEAEAALRGRVPWQAVRSWAREPALWTILADRVRAAQSLFSPAEPARLPLIFTAHSLPTKILREHDPYPDEVRATGEGVARELGWQEYRFSWQSRGRTREPWLEPDILETLSELAHDGWRQALVCPVGFVADHLEVLYDLDIQARAHAQQLGMHLERTASLNDDPALLRMLVNIIIRTVSA
jgi:ferrochelatase